MQPSSIYVDGRVSVDNEGNTAVTPGLTTTQPGDLLVALVSGYGPNYQQSAVTGGGLTWTKATGANGQGPAEIWTARAHGDTYRRRS